MVALLAASPTSTTAGQVGALGGELTPAAALEELAQAGERRRTVTVPRTARESWAAVVRRQATLPPAQERAVPPPQAPAERRIRSGRPAPGPDAGRLDPVSPAGTLPGGVFAVPEGDVRDANLDDNTSIPPDTMGTVGPEHLLAMTNQQVRIWQRDGTLLGDVTLDAFWTAGCPGHGFYFDPRVHYDPPSDRWFAVVLADGNLETSAVCFAASDGADPAGTWSFYTFVADDGELFDGSFPIWADFPGRLGMNDRWIPITANMFTTGCPACLPASTKMWVIDKSTALAGGPLTVTVFLAGFDLVLSEDCGLEPLGSFTMQPAVHHEPSDTQLLFSNTFLADDTTREPLLRISRLTGAADSPVWEPVIPASGEVCPGTGFFQAPVSFGISASDLGNNTPFVGMIDAAQAGMDPANDPAMGRVETNDSRMSDVVVRDGRLWATHVGGLPCCGSAAADRTAVFWYEIDPVRFEADGVGFLQVGTVDGGTDVHHFFPSIAVNSEHEALLGFSRSDATRFVEAAFTGRLPDDPPGTMRTVGTYRPGLDTYVRDAGSGMVRWGDYSATLVDPLDDRTFWTIQEYAHEDVGPDPADDRFRTVWARIVPPHLELFISDAVDERADGARGAAAGVITLPFPGTAPTRR